MQRIPLLLATPTGLWNRELSEIDLFQQTLGQANEEENRNFFETMEEQANYNVSRNYDLANARFKHAMRILKANRKGATQAALRNLNFVILRGPRESDYLLLALKQRGSLNMQAECLKSAVKDFEFYLELQGTEDLFEIYGKLTVCYYLMRVYKKARQYCHFYKSFRAIQPSEVLKAPPFASIDGHISAFEDELHFAEDCVPEISIKSFVDLPFKGFNSNPEIPVTSSVCFYRETKDSGSVYTSCEIPRDEVVLIENPLIYSVRNPLEQCEFCFIRSNQMYTCLNCRYKTYCSMECFKEDMPIHRHECPGYRILFLPLHGADSLLRLFIRVSKLIEEHIMLNLKSFEDLETADAIWNTLLTTLRKKRKFQGGHLLKYLESRPNYLKMNKTTYASLVSVAFRVTLYIETYTTLMDAHFYMLNISARELLILIGALVMRLNGHLLLNSVEIDYPCKSADIEIDKALSITTEISKDDGNSKTVTCQEEKTYTQPISVWTTYCDAIADTALTTLENKSPELTHLDLEHFIKPKTQTSLCKRIIRLKRDERMQFVEFFCRYFHSNFAKYFIQLRSKTNSYCLLSILCSSLHKFRYSCQPNVQIILLDNGAVLGKTVRTLTTGDELLVSYKSHYLRYNKDKRDAFYSVYGMHCNCTYCTTSETEPLNMRMGLYCCNCKTVVTPKDFKCSSCSTEYSTLCKKFINELKEIDDRIHGEISEAEKEAFYARKYTSLILNFVPTHKIRINGSLEYAMFLALQNDGEKAIEILRTVLPLFEGYYDDNTIIFEFEKAILLIIGVVMHFNLDEKLLSATEYDLKEICRLGEEFLSSMIELTEFEEKTDANVIKLIADQGRLLSWQNKIVENCVLPLMT